MNKLTRIGGRILVAGVLCTAAVAQAGVAPLSATFTKAYGAASIPLNGSTSVTYTITDTGSGGAVSGLAFGDALPAGLVVSTPSGSGTTCLPGGVVTAIDGTTSVSLSGGSVVPNGTCTVSVNVTGTTPGLKTGFTTPLTATSHVLGPAGATAALTVLAAAVAAASIPTLSEWGLILLVLAMAASAFNAMRRKR